MKDLYLRETKQLSRWIQERSQWGLNADPHFFLFIYEVGTWEESNWDRLERERKIEGGAEMNFTFIQSRREKFEALFQEGVECWLASQENRRKSE